MLSPRARWLAAALLAVALGARIGYTAKLHGGFERGPDSWDAEGYDRMGQRWLDTGRFLDNQGRPMTEREPGWPLLLAAAHGALGRSPWVGLGATIVIDVLSCWLVFLLTRRLFDETAAFCALAMAAVYPEWVYYSAFTYREPVVGLLTVWWLWLWSGARAAASAGRYALMGLAFAAAGLVRSPIMPLGPAFLALAARLLPARLWPRTLGVFCVAAVLLILPWAERNRRATGALVAGSTMGGVTMYMSLIKDYDKPEEALEHKLFHGEAAPVRARAEAAGGPAEIDRAYYRECWRLIKTDPGRFAYTFVRKALKLWRLYPSPGRRYQHEFGALFWVGLLSNGPVFLLAALGLWWSRRRWAELDLLLAVPLVMTLVYGLWWSTARYRSPIMACLFPLAGYACARILRRAR